MAKITLLILMSVTWPCYATFSIVAVDTVTREVGGAGASCIQNSRIINDLIIGVGAIHTQALYLAANQNYAHSLMELGIAPDDIVDSLVAHDAFENPTIRQYGIVDLVNGGRFAAFTGENCTDWAGHRSGPNYAIQGNILLSENIVDTMEYAFTHATGRLDEKLMAALEAAKVPGADTRCAPVKSAISAFIHVARLGDNVNEPYLYRNVSNTTGNTDPIDVLRTEYDEWLVEISTSADPFTSEVTTARSHIDMNGDTTLIRIVPRNNQGELLNETAQLTLWTARQAFVTEPVYAGGGVWTSILTSIDEEVSDTITIYSFSGTRVRELNTHPVVTYLPPGDAGEPAFVPDNFQFSVFPNPFNGQLSIRFALSRSEQVTLSIYDLAGRIVATVCSGTRPAGEHMITWTPDNLSSGLYFAEIQTHSVSRIQKVFFLK